MLRYVGKTIQNEFGEMNSYRIGGDEFVALLTDESEDRIRVKIEQIREQVEKRILSHCCRMFCWKHIR